VECFGVLDRDGPKIWIGDYFFTEAAVVTFTPTSGA
jgi:hypothetical protein